ncbi:chymotrypsin inhibitor-like [Halictus rubicundus]|uniref:chymotrypsin inhibitor-like n=1 Tax=Halictus rubicundus TaxID=77578 RepID=UPI0040353C8B
MSRFVFVLIAVLAVFSASSNGQQCGVNEEFNSCGTACEPRCGQEGPRACTMQCVIGCQCKTGFLRSASGSCVAPQDC